MKKDPYALLREQMTQSPKAWRSVAHKDGEPAVAETLEHEFHSPPMTPDGFNRREALKLAGASLALGPLAGCKVLRRPEEEILPFTRMPESVIPGVRLNYATAHARSEGAVGLLVEANSGRPTKIEGNPNHPASLGGTDLWAQAEVMRLYDPDRARLPLNAGKGSTWEAYDAFANDLAGKLAASAGKGLAVLAEEGDSPTFERLLQVLATQLPEAKLYRWDPLAPDHQRRGAELAFGPSARAHYDFEKVKVAFALDSNFLIEGPEHLKVARQFGKKRSVASAAAAAGMNRLYVAEGLFSTTGANADHRVRVSSAQAGQVLAAVARELAQKHGVDLGEITAALPAGFPEGTEKFVAVLARDLSANKGSTAIMVGERQPPAVHALAFAINAALGSPMAISRPPAAAGPRGFEGLSALAAALNGGAVQQLVIFDANPVFTAPGALKFGEALAKAATVVHVGVAPDETAARATWHVPAAHFLEAWGDARAWDGTVSLVQPLIMPIFGSRAATSVLAQLIGHAERNDLKLVEETWRAAGQGLAEGKAWRRALHDGLVPQTAFPVARGEAQRAAVAGALGALAGPAPTKDALEVVAFHSHVLDGRLGNITWLQELPESMSKLCWDNAALVSPALAKELGINSQVNRNGYTADTVTLTVDGSSVTAPTFVLPGLARNTVAFAQGYGRSVGEIARAIGVDAQALFADARGVAAGVKLVKTGNTQVLCSTQDHFSVPGDPYKPMTFAEASGQHDATGKPTSAAALGLGARPLFMSASAADYQKEGAKVVEGSHAAESLVQLGTPRNRPTRLKQMVNDIVFEGQQWGMVIDLSSCTGCNVCAVACVAENNIPSVGRDQVLLGRELHWIRVDRYFEGDVDEPTAMHQPVNCMHCENAPCEPVCPVAATVHDEEGINSMAYNRCIGTRYCANNCPFKVRRFNYLDFTVTGNLSTKRVLESVTTPGFNEMKWEERWKTMQLQRNPDVTVRYRGIMEKCTYCTQRVEEAKIMAKRRGEDRKALPDGAITPACAQACPTQAITFGNINDPKSKVAQLKVSDRNYEMLQELNIRPRTTFLARIKNQNQELA